MLLYGITSMPAAMRLNSNNEIDMMDSGYNEEI